MALLKSWKNFMQDAGIPESDSDTYAQELTTNQISISSAPELTRELLTELKVKSIGHALSIIRHAKHTDTKPSTQTATAKPANVKPPQLSADITHPQFRKFKIDWNVYKTISNIQPNQIPAQLYSTCDSDVQNSIINTAADFFNQTEEEILRTLELIVTKRTNPTVHRMTFGNITQFDGESTNDYVVRLNATSKDCEFTCPNCSHDLSPIHIRDQFIRGISNANLQTDILAKAGTLKTVDDVIKHSQAYEAAIQDQHSLQDSATSDVAAFQNRRHVPAQEVSNPGTDPADLAAAAAVLHTSILNGQGDALHGVKREITVTLRTIFRTYADNRGHPVGATLLHGTQQTKPTQYIRNRVI